jgi:hypothetical protein
MTVSMVARQYRVAPSQLFLCLAKQIKELQRMLGKKTMELSYCAKQLISAGKKVSR